MRFKEIIEKQLMAALDACGYPSGDERLVLERPRMKEHGDIASPVALSLARVLKKNPMQIAERIASELSFPQGEVAKIEIAKPGYINLHVAPERLARNLEEIVTEGDRFGSSEVGGGTKCQIEYVSANPTGPLVVVSARAAAVGSVLVNLLKFVGFDVDSEYYVNDHGSQVRALGESLRHRVRERAGTVEPGEEPGAYPGEYLKEIAQGVSQSQIDEWDGKDDVVAEYGRYATDNLLRSITEDLHLFGVSFDRFFRESDLHRVGVDEARRMVEEKGYAYTDEGALYFRTTEFGDEKDRVLVKSDGKPTYFLGDIAYHLDKLRRGYEWVIDLLGPDHHGHIPRMKAAATVLGADDKWLSILTVGWVRLLEGDKPVSMSKRAGEIITMRELVEDVGPDVAKYIFLTRRANSPLDFDLELARKQSEENPVYYVQYAHARIMSVIQFAEGKVVVGGEVTLDRLDAAGERDLMVHLLYFPYEVESAALCYEPHRLTNYARELATLFHKFYHEHRIVTDDVELSNARLYLVRATRQVLNNVLGLTGVAAPNSM
jgi:arginyl-tRNA synthetase